MIKTITNRLFLLVTMLLLSTVNALAQNVAKIGNTEYATLAEAIAEVQDDQTITLLADCETGSGYTNSDALKIANAGTTLDLNGKTLTVTNNFSFCVTASNVTVKNGTIASGVNTAKATKLNSYILVIGGVAKDATISGVTIEKVKTQGGISVGGSSDSEVKGIAKNTVIKNCKVLSGDFYAVCSQNKSNVTINGGEYTANTASTGSTVLQACFTGDDGPEGTISVVAGTFTGAIFTNNINLISITGGTFSVDPTAFVAEGYKAVDNNGTWTVRPAVVAKIGGTEYATLQAAIDAASADDVIELLKDFELITVTSHPSKNYNVEINKSITIDGKGFKITSSQGKRPLVLTGEGNNITLKNLTVINKDNVAALWISNALTCTLDNTVIDGTDYAGAYNQVVTISKFSDEGRVVLNVTNGSVIKTNDEGKAHYAIFTNHPTDINVTKSTIKGWAAVYVKSPAAGTNVTISNSTLVSSNAYSNVSNAFAAFVMEDNNVTVNVTNSKITLNNTGDQDQAIAAAKGQNDEVVTGAVVNLGAGNKVTFDGPGTSKFAINYAEVKVSGGEFNAPVPEDCCAEGYVPTALGNNLYGVKQAVPVAKIDDVEYTTLAKAFAAAQDGETIKLIADCELTEVLTNTKNVTLDLGTFAIYGTIEDFMIQNKGTLVITADETNPGKIYNTVFAKRRGPVCNLAEGNITINGGIFGDNDADPTNVSTVNGGWGFFNLGTAIINGGIFTTGDPDYSSNPTVWAYAINNGDDGETSTAHLTINGGKVYGKHGDIANDSGTMIINNVTTFGTAQYYNIYCERGDVTVNGGTFAKQVGKINLHVYADATATVTVKGGTFTKNTINSTFAGGNGTVALMGGTYNKQPEAKVVAAGYEVVNNNNGTWTVSPAAVAKIGDVKYTSFEAAFAAAQDGQTIKLLANCSGNGIIAPQGKFATGLTVDFGGFTYTVNGTTLAGSAGTKTQAFQLLKDNKITFTNGTIVGNTADVKMLIQNYSDLTLDHMTLDATQGDNSVNYVLSTNNGNTVINHTTITAKTNGKAFDVDSGWGNYESNSVELMGPSVINGDIEVAFEGKTDGTPSVLKLTFGTLNGKIVMGTGANQCTVIKGTNFVAAAPEGYEWKDNDKDTKILKAIEYINDVKDESGKTVVAKETATIANNEATITKVEIAQEGVKNVTVSAAINNANVTEIAVGAFKSLANTAVQTIDLSSTQVALSGERSKNPVLKDIPATALIYLPSSSSEVEGTNVVIKEAENKYTCNDFQMLDEQDYSVPTPFTATTATLTRSFTSGLHCTVCLPYDVPESDINNKGTIYRYTSFSAAGPNGPTIYMTAETGGLKANVPYIFVPNSGTSSISASNIEVKMIDKPQTTEGNFTFKGVFEEKRFTEAEHSAGIYGYAGENKFNFSQGAFYKLGINAYVPATRAYLVANSVAGAPAANGVKAAQSLPTKIQVVLKNADGETTDILHFDMETAEDDAPVYNLSGQRVNHAEKGVYIKNGKKVIIK